MSFDGHRTCPHCRALAPSTICSICGKSSFEEVAASVERAREKWWRENGEIRKVGSTLAALLLIGGIAVWIVTRPDGEITATALPPPDPDALDVDDPEPKAPVAPPAADGVMATHDIIIPSAPREVSDGLSPWETLPPVDFVTGQFLDDDIDYAADIDRVGELLAAFPAGLALESLDPPEIQTFDGVLDVGVLETTQPFAARTIVRNDGTAVGGLWLIASSGSEVGDAYLASARERWDVDAAIDSYAPSTGLRLWALARGDGVTVWATDLEPGSMLIIQAPTLVSPEILTDSLRAWRRSIAAQ